MAEVARVVALEEPVDDTDGDEDDNDGDEDSNMSLDENLDAEEGHREDAMQPALLPDSSGDSFQRIGRIRDRRRRQCINAAFVGATLLILVLLEWRRSDWFGGKGNENKGGSYEEYELRMKSQSDYNKRNTPFPITSIVPSQLLGTLYQSSDFVNERSVIPTFWSYDLNNSSNSSTNNSTPTANTTVAPKTASALQINAEFNHNGIPSWGPCYPPRRATSSSMNWQQEISRAKQLEPEHEYRRSRDAIAAGIDGMCRPGFIIIGAGKCGTSSLYHYLTGHPRILPAYSKQIHYFVVSRDTVTIRDEETTRRSHGCGFCCHAFSFSCLSFISLVASFNSCHCFCIQINSTTWQYHSTMQRSLYPGIFPFSPPLPTFWHLGLS
jgi:hypothetical protein